VIDLRTGDCRAVLRGLADASADAIVTDPPYALTSAQGKGFMGKAWDGALPGVEVWAECFRVARPGAHLIAFGGTRTHHRLMCAIEDAGWEIRDCLIWVYGSGFPKSLDVSKAIDKAVGAEREVVGTRLGRPGISKTGNNLGQGFGRAWEGRSDRPEPALDITATDAARRWAGWGTALKPAWEIIVLARKPLDGTVANNVLAHGTGALNIDGCRVPAPDGLTSDGHFKPSCNTYAQDEWTQNWERPRSEEHPAGRWPPNFLLTHHPDCNGSCVEGCPVRGLDAQGVAKGSHGAGFARPEPGGDYKRLEDGWGNIGNGLKGFRYGDSGGVSRFFPTFAWDADDFFPLFYCPKASRAERGEGNTHPTVKPLALMRWLARLVCPPGGTLVDPFCGSGTTLLVADAEGFAAIGCDDDPESVAIARRRLDAARAGTPLFTS
jgi:hypothetical protein